MLKKITQNLLILLIIGLLYLPNQNAKAEESNTNNTYSTPQISLITDFDQKSLSLEIYSYKGSVINIYLNCKLLKTITLENNSQIEPILDNWVNGKKYSIMADQSFDNKQFSDCSNVILFIAPNNNSSNEINSETNETEGKLTIDFDPIENPPVYSNQDISQNDTLITPNNINSQSNFFQDSESNTSQSNTNINPILENSSNLIVNLNTNNGFPINKFEIIQVNPEILGVSNSNISETDQLQTKCKIKVHKDLRTIEQKPCKITKPVINKAIAIKDRSLVKVTTEGLISPDPIYTIQYYRCKPKTLWDPRTWFKCIDQKYMERTLKPDFINKISSDNHDYINYYYYNNVHVSNPEYKLEKTYLNYTPLKISVRNKKFGSIYLLDQWVDLKLSSKYQNAELIYSEESNNNKPLELPLQLPTGVTQWYGYTAFQNPHSGIDFGIREKEIYAPASGFITNAQWDNYSGECLSGGHFIKIKHDNGYYSLYLHLKNYLNDNGKAWKPGDRINKGDLIGISGNSGAFNCQSLGYHLHYETRTESLYTTHTDPVPITNTDWNQIPTLGWQYTPGRLSGNNPHPNY